MSMLPINRPAMHARTMGERTVFCALRRYEIFLLVFTCAAVYAFLSFSSSSSGGGGGRPVSGEFPGTEQQKSIVGKLLGDSRSDDLASMPKAVLLPMPMDFIRRGFPVAAVYNFPQRSWEGDCSCLNPKADSKCCRRTFFRAHKVRKTVGNGSLGFRSFLW